MLKGKEFLTGFEVNLEDGEMFEQIDIKIKINDIFDGDILVEKQKWPEYCVSACNSI